jgi:hypothetical protein
VLLGVAGNRRPEVVSIERIYRNLPEPVAKRLLADGLLEQPNEVIDSAEGGIRLPSFKSKEEFDAFVEQLAEAAGEVAETLLAEAELATKKDGGPPLDVTEDADAESPERTAQDDVS